MRFATVVCTSATLVFAAGLAAAQGNKLTDPQIAHIAYTAGQIDIQAAQLALQKSKNKEVRAFATQMERDHKAVNDKALALLNKLKGEWDLDIPPDEKKSVTLKSPGEIEYYCRYHPNMVGQITVVQ